MKKLCIRTLSSQFGGWNQTLTVSQPEWGGGGGCAGPVCGIRQFGCCPNGRFCVGYAMTSALCTAAAYYLRGGPCPTVIEYECI